MFQLSKLNLSQQLRKVQKWKSDLGMDIGMLQTEIDQNTKARKSLESINSPRSKNENKKDEYHVT